MIVYRTKEEISAAIAILKSTKQNIGFVPTMGALHNGHIALVQKGLNQNDCVVVSVFVNPTQFDNAADLHSYPRTLDQDVALLQRLNAHVLVYAPSVSDIYGDDIQAKSFEYDGLEHEMEGAFRPGHFDGVGTIVKRLFEIVQPDRAYFGEKDFQQLRIIQKMVEKHKMSVQIVPCEIYRAEDGLAMSSRNVRLTPAHRDAAPFIFKTLQEAKVKFGTKSAKEVSEWVENVFESQALFRLEYFTVADEETLKPIQLKSDTKHSRAFIAVFADDVRLIDNIALN